MNDIAPFQASRQVLVKINEGEQFSVHLRVWDGQMSNFLTGELPRVLENANLVQRFDLSGAEMVLVFERHQERCAQPKWP